MGSRPVYATIDRFAGLSDRSIPVNLTRIECPDLRNVEFANRALERRNGHTRITSTAFKDSSVQLDGLDDFIIIQHLSAYQPGASDRLYLSCCVKKQRFPAAEKTIISKGSGTTTSRFLWITYDPTINTNNGGWRLRVYDNTAGTLRNVTVNDGNGSSTGIVNLFRHLSLVITDAATNTYTFTVRDDAGATVGTAQTLVIGSWITNSNPWTIGVSTTNGTVRDTDYGAFSIAELRMDMTTGATQPSFVSVYTRELTTDEALTAIGYWKCNDGIGITLDDSSPNANDGYAIGEGTNWLTGDLVNGVSGLQFAGSSDPGALVAPAHYGGFVHWRVANVASNTAGDLFTNDISGGRNWVVSLLYVPLLAANETTVRNQTLLWAGTDATNPAPIAISVLSDRIIGQYYDGTTLHPTLTLSSLTLSAEANVGKRIRINLRLYQHPTATPVDDVVELVAFVETAAGGYTTYTTNTVITAPIDPSAAARSAHWCIGDKFSDISVVPPATRGTTAFGVIDSVYAIKANASGFAALPAQHQPPWGQETGAVSAFYTMLAGLPLDDGQGTQLRTVGSQTTTAQLYPEDGFGLSRDEGMVDPYDPPFCQLVHDYRRFDSLGSLKREMLIVSGTSLYAVNVSNGSIKLFSGGLVKGTLWTAAQYSDRVFLASDNGKRPMVYDGDKLRYVGIRAPQATPVITTVGAGGAFAAGDYYIYVTYRNAESGTESNPSPGVLQTLTLNQQITTIELPVSADKQVNQRRIWATAVATTGSAADAPPIYLIATVEDNTTVTYAPSGGIDGPSATGTTLADFTINEEAPQGSLVATWKDRLWVAGQSENPTRIYFSDAGALDSFDQTVDYVDADLDTGDACTSLKPMLNQLLAHFRDGRVAITFTGSSTDPFFPSYLSKDTGCVGPMAVIPFESGQFFVSERDVFLWDGYNALNLSSPTQTNRPSIQTTIRTGLSSGRLKYASVAIHRSRNQLWIACSSSSASRNDMALVFDISQGIWSRYDIDLDSILEVEDENDEPGLYGTSRGFLVQLDSGTYDGNQDTIAVLAGTALGTHGATSLQDTSKAWTTDEYKGLYCYWYDISTANLYRTRIAGNTATTLTFYDDQVYQPADSDPYAIAGIDWYADFMIDFGDFFQNKRLKWFKAIGESDVTNNFHLILKPNNPGRAWTYAGAADYHRTWTATESFKRIPIGGVGRSFRLRVAETGYPSAAVLDAIPSASGKISVFKFEVEAEALEAL